LCTVVLPDGGTSRVLGHDVVQSAGKVRKLIGFVNADDRSFYWRLSVLENLAFFASLDGATRGQAIAEADRVIRAVDLEPLANQPVMNLSSGMRQRLGMARALLGRPQVLLLDEPTRSLDPATAARLEVELLTMASDLNLTFLLATHDLAQARRVAGQAIILREGQLVETEALGPRDVRTWAIARNPSSAGFPPHANFHADSDGGTGCFSGNPRSLTAWLAEANAAGVEILDLNERPDDQLDQLLGIET